MTSDDAVVHLRIPASLKARWIKESRSQGLRLTEWVISRIERTSAPMQKIAIIIPAGINFADLKLCRDSTTGAVRFDWMPIERICEASGIDITMLRDGPEDNVAELLTSWYAACLSAGMPRDPIMDDLIGETVLENMYGGSMSHTPGKS